MNRREVITVLGGAGASLPLAVVAQLLPKRPAIGWLSGGAPRSTRRSSKVSYKA